MIGKAVQRHPRYAPVAMRRLKTVTVPLQPVSMVRLEKRLQSKEQKLDRVLQHAGFTPELLIAAALFYDYAFSGVVDGERKQRYIKEAYEFYQRIRGQTNDTRAATWVGRLRQWM